MSNVSAVVAASPSLSMATVQRTGTAQPARPDSAAYSAAAEVVTYTAPASAQAAAQPALKLFISFGEHAREMISSEVGLRFLQLLSDPHLLAAQASAHLSAAELAHLQLLLSCCVALQV